MATYFRSIFADFVYWDDDWKVARNQFFHPATILNIAHFWTRSYNGDFLPITYTLLGIVSRLAVHHGAGVASPSMGGDLDPLPFHLINVALHIINSCLVLAILLKLSGNRPGSLLGALVWSIHPLQVESVAWVCGLDRVLCGTFSFTSILLYLTARTQPAVLPAKRSGRTTTLLAFSLSIGLLALLCKPVAIMLPATILILETVLIGHSLRDVIRPLALWQALTLPVIAISQWAAGASVAAFSVPILQRFELYGDSVAFYFFKLIFPSGLAIDYGRRADVILHSWWGIADSLAVAALLFAGWRLRHTLPWVWGGLLIFVLNIAPVSGLVAFPFQNYSNVADRYVYIGMLGVSITVAFAFAKFKGVLAVRTALAGGLAVILALGMISMHQVKYWRDSPSLFEHAISINPKSDLSIANLGYYYLNVGNTQKAIELLNEAIRINPNQQTAYFNLGSAYSRTGRRYEAERSYESAVRVNPSMSFAHYNLGNSYLADGRLHDAMVQYQAAASLAPDEAIYHDALGLSLAQQGMVAAGIKEFQTALQINPNDKSAADNLQLARQLSR